MVPTSILSFQKSLQTDVMALDKRGLSDFGLRIAMRESTSTPNTLFTSPSNYATLALGFPELEFSAAEVVGWPRKSLPTVGGSAPSYSAKQQRYSEPGRDVIFLRDSSDQSIIIQPVSQNNCSVDKVYKEIQNRATSDKTNKRGADQDQGRAE